MPSSPWVNGVLQINEIQKLRQRERDHREIDALAADRDDAGDDAKPCGTGGTDQNSKLGCKTPDLQRMRGDVARSPPKTSRDRTTAIRHSRSRG